MVVETLSRHAIGFVSETYLVNETSLVYDIDLDNAERTIEWRGADCSELREWIARGRSLTCIETVLKTETLELDGKYIVRVSRLALMQSIEYIGVLC